MSGEQLLQKKMHVKRLSTPLEEEEEEEEEDNVSAGDVRGSQRHTTKARRNSKVKPKAKPANRFVITAYHVTDKAGRDGILRSFDCSTSSFGASKSSCISSTEGA